MEGLIIGPAGSVRVEPKAMAVLLELAKHGGEVCSRDQIQQAVWPRGFTTDDVLTRCIGQLRRALGDNPKDPEHLETLPRRGYRLRATATPFVKVAQTAPVESTGKLIVLPFQFLASDADSFIADGMTELLTARLAPLQGISVISRTTAMSFKGSTVSIQDVAAQTGAQWVVEGSILLSGDRVQVVVQLIDARTDAHIWADDYLRDLGDILELQNEIARKIADTVRVRIGSGEDTDVAAPLLSAGAMRNYLMGRQLISQRSIDSLQAATGCFTKVIQEFPDYADAWASRGESRFMLCHYGAISPRQGAAACRSDIQKALETAPNSAIAVACQGMIRFSFDRNYVAAEIELRRALELSPGYTIALLNLANVCNVQRRFDEANDLMQQALHLDPLDIGINMNFGDHLILQRRFDDAARQLLTALELAQDHKPTLMRLAWAYALADQANEALEVLSRAGPGNESDWRWFEYGAMVHSVLGNAAEANRCWQRILSISQQEFVSSWSLARAATAAGDFEAATGWLESAIDSGSTSLPFIAVTPAFDALRNQPEYTRIADKLGASSD